MHMRKIALAMGFVLVGCSSDADDDTGTVTVTAYGESFIEDGIPASEFDDGWQVEFTRFEVNMGAVRVGDTEFSVPASIDLVTSSSGNGHELASAPVAAGDYEDASFVIERVEVEGQATRDAETKSFDWVFEQSTLYSQCEAATSVEANGHATFQITVHADHLFYNSLVADDPPLLFQPLADADTDADHKITKAELAAADIGSYDPGSEGGIDDLWAWLVAQTHTLGHVNGEGHCDAEPKSD